MAGERKRNSQRRGALVCALMWAVCAYGQTVRHHREEVVTDSVAPQVRQAESAIEKQDYAGAEKLLLPVVAANPKDSTAWYDLGYVYKATKRRSEAIDAYRKCLATKPDVYQANLSLGLLLAQSNQDDEAAKYVKSALRLMPATTTPADKALNWMALGKIEQKSNPVDAVAAFRKAAEFTPKDIEPHLLVARLLASARDVGGAEKEYKAAHSIDPHAKEPLTGLIDLYRENGQTQQAQSALSEYEKQFPDDPKAHLLLGQSLLKAGDTQAAIAQFDAGLKESPGDETVLHEVAAMYASQKEFEQAAARYAELVKAAPGNADYRYQYGVVLMQLHRFPEAQDQIITALKENGRLIDAYGDLAVVASENKQYPLTINVLDARSKLIPDTAGTYFLRATAYDNLKAFPQAVENYHKFLEASNGKDPDNEWKARHRLIAIEPENGKKKK
jgi:tetratricopeptide (TPR) repeat protein